MTIARIKVADPDGAEWRVWRRWYAWRRRVTLADIGEALGEATDGIAFLFAVPLSAIGLVVTLVDLVSQVVALPFVVLARLMRLASWPVQLDRNNKHIRTLQTKGFRAADELRDDLARQVQDGTLPDRPPPEPPRGTPAQVAPTISAALDPS